MEQEVEIIDHTLSFKKSITLNNIRLEFIELSPDSRCPKEVSCIRAGEAIAIIELYKDNKLEETLELKFYPNGVLEQLSDLLRVKNINIKNLRLLPYPQVNKVKTKEDYAITFSVIETL